MTNLNRVSMLILCTVFLLSAPLSGAVTVPLATDMNQTVWLTQGFNTAGDHAGNQLYAVDLNVPEGTAILAPANGYVIYSRYANGALTSACQTAMAQVVFGSGNTIRRDDNLNTSNALWTVNFWDPTGATPNVTYWHIRDQTLQNKSQNNPPAGAQYCSAMWTSVAYPVTAGQKIAETGGNPSTPGKGFSYGAHLHTQTIGDFNNSLSASTLMSLKVRVRLPNGQFVTTVIDSSQLYNYNLYSGAFYGVISAGGSGSGLQVGMGASNPQPWIAAYYRNSFSAYVTGPSDVVHLWGNGCIQDFTATTSGLSDVLMQMSCNGTVFGVYGAMWSKLLGFGGATSFVGYPTGDRKNSHSSASGFTVDRQSFQGADFVLHTDARSRWNKQTFAVIGAIRSAWINSGAETSWLGAPVSDEYTSWYEWSWWGWYQIRRSDFEHGYILWHQVSGSIEVHSY